MNKKNGSFYSRALTEMRRKEPALEKAATLLNSGMNQRDWRCAYALGTWHLFGRYFNKNKKKGMSLIRKAAEHDVPDALFDWAVSLETGDGARKSPRKAALMFLRAALLGHKHAIYEVGRCFFHGIGVPKDRLVAREWYGRAKAEGISPHERYKG